MDEKLLDFIRHARQKGMDHATIRVLLVSAGWREKEIAQAMAAEGLDLPVPEPHAAGSAREVFVYLLTSTALYTMVVSLILLFFNYLDLLFPDPAWDSRFFEESRLSAIRWSLAALIVSAPLFFSLASGIARDIRRNPAKVRSPIRRVLAYLTLFVAAITLMFNLITLLYYFLDGALSTRFVLKVLVLFVIAGTVFTYYLLSLRNSGEAKT